MTVNNSHDGLPTREDAGPELVIFDSDGVLVDSEPITGSVLVSLLEQLGYHITAEQGVKLCRGRKMADIIADIQSLSGIELSDDFIATFRLRVAEQFRTELRPIAGIREVLEGLALPHCVASSGPNERINAALGVTGVQDDVEPLRDAGAVIFRSMRELPSLLCRA